ncbi:hypothetical protein EWM64_g927 [Hericium alpestre]|uniref:Cytochrome P450 n=1 Tax=Hericium alpestre TaxID=135208 RepID=A0A4Z0A9R9_9AGAM|nr:hypothetical protein EWM64_g927 [Hericium alpestre]
MEISGLEASLVALMFLTVYLTVRITYPRKRGIPIHRPPIVKISLHDLLMQPREAYELAMAEYGPVIGVHRLGKVEYIVSEEYFEEVLTNDNRFSFERGIAHVDLAPKTNIFLNGSFIRDMHEVVTEGIISRLSEIIENIAPIIIASTEQSIQEAILNSETRGSPVADVVASSHRAISETMLTMFFGREAGLDDCAVSVCEEVSNRMVSVTGIDAYSKPWYIKFPWLYKMRSWARLILCLCRDAFPIFLPLLWRAIRNHNHGRTDLEDEKPSFMTLLLRRHVDQTTGHVPMRAIIPMACVLLGAIILVWVIFEIADRPEYIPLLREEIDSLCGADGIPTYDELRRAERLDSFIREVMRTKGDVLGVMREADEGCALGGYIIPRGHLVYPLSTLAHMNTFLQGFDAEQFDGTRWVRTGKLATMPSMRYLVFGLGRFACPGRMLAITGAFSVASSRVMDLCADEGAEIKLWVIALLRLATPALEEKYTVSDLMSPSLAPRGTLLLHPIENHR